MLHGAARRLVEPLVGVERVAYARGECVWRGRAQQASGRLAARDHAAPSVVCQPLMYGIDRLRRGQQVRVRFTNRLDEPTTVHWHGLDVPEQADGHPRFAIGPGQMTWARVVSARR